MHVRSGWGLLLAGLLLGGGCAESVTRVGDAATSIGDAVREVRGLDFSHRPTSLHRISPAPRQTGIESATHIVFALPRDYGIEHRIARITDAEQRRAIGEIARLWPRESSRVPEWRVSPLDADPRYREMFVRYYRDGEPTGPWICVSEHGLDNLSVFRSLALVEPDGVELAWTPLQPAHKRLHLGADRDDATPFTPGADQRLPDAVRVNGPRLLSAL